MPKPERLLSKEQLQSMLVQVAQEAEDASLDVALQLLAAALGVHKSTVRRAMLDYGLSWHNKRERAADTPCSQCGAPSRAIGLCSMHHRLELRLRPPEEQQEEAPVKFVAIRDCEATPGNVHLWISQHGTRICFYCREPFSCILRRRQECSTRPMKRS